MQDLYCGQVSKSGCKNHYNFVLGVRAEVKNMTTYPYCPCQQLGYLFFVIQGQSSLISQFLHPTNLEIKGIIRNPIIEKITIKTSTLTEYRVIRRYIPTKKGINQFGKTIRILRLNTFLNKPGSLREKNFDEMIP